MAIDPRRIEVVDHETAARLRKMTGAQRVEMGLRMGAFARAIIERSVRAMHPEWDDLTVGAEVRRRFAGAG